MRLLFTGVTTILGLNHTAGREDGTVEKATFSNDFELVFVPEICALMVSDHGNQLVRQIDLNAEDCRRGSGSGSGQRNETLFVCLFFDTILIVL